MSNKIPEKRQQSDVEKLRSALESLVYKRDGRWFVGVRGDEDVTGIVGSALEDQSEQKP